MNRGRFRHRIRLEWLADVLDTSGDVLQDPNTGEVPRSWQLVAEVWAAIEPVSAREFIASQAKQAEVVARIIVEFREIDPAWRIVHNGKIYNILGVLPDKDSGRDYITMPVSAGLTDGR